jgi:hypothetical protein
MLSTEELGCRYVDMKPKLFDEFLAYLSRVSRAVGRTCPYPLIRIELALPTYSRGLRRLRLPSGDVWVAFHRKLSDLRARLGGNAATHIRGLLKSGCDPVVVVFRGPYFAIFGVRAQFARRKR